MSGNGNGPPYYGRARIAGGLVLFLLASILMVVDSIRPDYNVESIQLGLLLGTGLLLLGVEAGRRIIGGGE